MKPSSAQRDDFLAHRPVDGVRFEHNDFVSVIDGTHAGDSGSIVSVEELDDDPIYLVELESNQDAYISQSFLRLGVA